MQDLTGLLKPDPVSALVPTSQANGNQVFENNAHTAPGGVSGDLGWDVGGTYVSPAPKIETQQKIPPGDSGKPQAKGENWSTQGAPAWKSTTVPDVIREK